MVATILGLLVWVPIALIRVALIIIGWLVIPLSLVADGAKRTPTIWKFWADAVATPAYYSTSRWGKYWWWGFRNPTPGLKNVFKQPIPEVHPNPDRIVRDRRGPDSAHRWMSHGIYWEYWYLREVGDRYFEFRIGWKFVDGNDEFFPTLQLRLGG